MKIAALVILFGITSIGAVLTYQSFAGAQPSNETHREALLDSPRALADETVTPLQPSPPQDASAEIATAPAEHRARETEPVDAEDRPAGATVDADRAAAGEPNPDAASPGESNPILAADSKRVSEPERAAESHPDPGTDSASSRVDFGRLDKQIQQMIDALDRFNRKLSEDLHQPASTKP